LHFLFAKNEALIGRGIVRLRHHASFKITPKRHQQLACHRHDGDAADAAFRGTDTRPEPDAQIAVGLIAQPQPGEFDPGGSPLAVTGLADPLVMGHVSALKRARRVADITRQLAAIVEFAMEYLANQHCGKLCAGARAERPAAGREDSDGRGGKVNTISSYTVRVQRMIKNSKDHLAGRHPDAASHIDPP
jgi:hypothetical protein